MMVYWEQSYASSNLATHSLSMFSVFLFYFPQHSTHVSQVPTTTRSPLSTFFYYYFFNSLKHVLVGIYPQTHFPNFQVRFGFITTFRLLFFNHNICKTTASGKKNNFTNGQDCFKCNSSIWIPF